MKEINLLMFMTLSTFFLFSNNLFGQEDYSMENALFEDYKLLAGDGSANDEFGFSISLDNGIIAVGVPLDDDNGSNSGSAYLFDASTGQLIVKLLPSDGTASAEFGFSIDIDNGIVAVGAKGDNENGANAGAAYLFHASTGNQLAKLLPTDGAPDDEFGNAVALDNGTVAVGAWRADEFGDASGAAYLFDATTGNQLDKLLPDSGNNFQTFGVSIALDDDIVAVGARTHFVPGEGYTFAKAYLFDSETGNQLNVLQPDILNLNGDLGGHFADRIAIHNGLVAVGAPNRSVVFDHSGAAYVFDAITGSQLTYIVPDDAHDRDNFGISIAIDDGIVAVGAHQDDDNGFNSGSGYLYNALTGTEISKLLASDGAVLDLLGTSIAIDEDLVVVGAKDDDDNGDNSGSAYVYSGIALGIVDTEFDDFSLYPNPGSDRVTLEFPSTIDEFDEIKIYNSFGQLMDTTVKVYLVGDTKAVLDVSEFKSGLYLIHVGLGDRTTVKKLLIE